MKIIAAITRDNALGRAGDMLYHISDDLRRFKAITMGHPVIMGRKTFESFPKGPLPGRRNMVVTRNADYAPEGVDTFPSLAEAIGAAGADSFVIGGGQIYSQAIDLADGLHITEIDADTSDADTYFPDIDLKKWQVTSISPWHTDERSGVRFRYVDYVRRQNIFG